MIAAKILNYRGQLYAMIGEKDCTNRNGEQKKLAVWRSNCADCGAPFEVTTLMPETALPTSLNRRCDAHKSAGRHVKGHPHWGRLVDWAALTAPLQQGE
ncbi:MAG: hypothetical protein HQM03_19830 [Magnetococcales bacterium]|nr:hypothetical protein [Magnetococcales bacterium]